MRHGATIACPPSFTVTCSTRTVCSPPLRYRLSASTCAGKVRASLLRARSALSCCGMRPMGCIHGLHMREPAREGHDGLRREHGLDVVLRLHAFDHRKHKVEPPPIYRPPSRSGTRKL